ncbi:MAG TPA: glycolate oxidase subunit GlcF [Gammaproteobacteria bacterium]|nr:glycolate oxidase subunit GlcF [Gammaproteobacteria bacterium]
METRLADFVRGTAEGLEAEAILRKCVHCGFCNATCPTYQILGDELDGPRGRIYLMKMLLEGSKATHKTQQHLDRCLTCRNCETTCPSGVQYGRLLDVVRPIADKRAGRGLFDHLQRFILAAVIPRRRLFAFLLRIGRRLRPVLPRTWASKIPPMMEHTLAPPAARRSPHRRRMLALTGCVQPALAPEVNIAAARVLDRLGMELVEAPGAGCCGALRFHLGRHRAALRDMRRNIDAWWPYIKQGVEAIVITASGCGVSVKEYGHWLRHDQRYAARAARISQLTRDVGEVVAQERVALRELLKRLPLPEMKVAYQAPCTLQHGQKLPGLVETLLAECGFQLTEVGDAHRCCGSAATYSLLQPALSQTLRDNKLAALTAGGPERILTANIGCQLHLQSGTPLRVQHWIELLDQLLSGRAAV